MSANIVAGEESESDSDVEEPTSHVTPLAIASTVEGEETESSTDDEEETEQDLAAQAVVAGEPTVGGAGSGPAPSGAGYEIPPPEIEAVESSEGDQAEGQLAGAPLGKPTSVRHRVVRERNKFVRRTVMNRMCARARQSCSAVEATAAHLSKCQGVVQDATDSLRLLDNVWTELNDKLDTMLSNQSLLPEVYAPFARLNGAFADAEELQAIVAGRLEAALPNSVSSTWENQRLHLTLQFSISQFARSHISFKFVAAKDSDQAWDALRTRRVIHKLHVPFIGKVDEAIRTSFCAEAAASAGVGQAEREEGEGAAAGEAGEAAAEAEAEADQPEAEGASSA